MRLDRVRVDLVLGSVTEHVQAVRAMATSHAKAIVLVNDLDARNACRSADLAAYLLAEYLPIDSADDLDAFDQAHLEIAELEAAVSSVRYRGVPVVAAIAPQLLGDLVFVKRAEAGIRRAQREGAAHVILGLTHYNASYLAIGPLAARAGHEFHEPFALHSGGMEPLRQPLVLDSAVRAARSQTPRSGETAIPSGRPAWLPMRQARSVFYLATNDADLYLQPVYPLIEAFSAAGTPFVALTEDARVIARLAPLGVPLVDVREVARGLARGADGRMAALGELFVALDSAPRSVSLDALLPFELNDALAAEATAYLAAADVFDVALRWLLPRSVFLMPDPMLSSVLVTTIARSHRIPTVTTVAASVVGSYRSFGVRYSDIVASYGLECSEAFRAMGWDERRIVLTGAPAMDRAARASHQDDRMTVDDALGLDRGAPLIVVATSRVAREDEWLLALAQGAAIHGWTVVVKPHPLHGMKTYSEIATKTPELPLLVTDVVPLPTLLSAADVVVTDYSHAGREALAFGRPLVAVNVTGQEFESGRYDEEGVAVGARSVDAVVPAVDTAISDHETRRRLEQARAAIVDRFNWKNDGHAAERLHRLLSDPPKVSAR